MRFDIHVRAQVQDQITQVASIMKSWEDQPRMDDIERAHVKAGLTFFLHTTQRPDLRLAGVDGTGDFPAVSYGDSFVYVSIAQRTVYARDSVSGLHELGPVADPLVVIAWIPEEEEARTAELDKAFASLAGMSIADVITQSDYHRLKSSLTRRSHTAAELAENLLRPHAADAGNIGLQLRSTAELGEIYRTIQTADALDYVLMDGTFSLPLVSHRANSLFYEHLKRLCCVAAHARGLGFFALSKSHGLPAMEIIEDLAREQAAVPPGQLAEHWYLRLPIPGEDSWDLSMAHGRNLPPPGAVTYLVRFHRTTPVMRLDMDRDYWRTHVKGATNAETQRNEQRIFADLDYAGHDQRCYGYPYPLKAAHDRASLTQPERVALRKQIVDAAVAAGMKRALFRDAAQATGHA